MTRPLVLLTASALLLGVLITACSGPDDSVSTPIEGPTGTAAPQPTQDDVPRDDLTEERLVVWDTAEAVGETSIRVTFWAGTHRCFGSRYVVREADEEIAIAVIEGKFPNAPEVCTEEARQASLLVETKQPVGERTIVPLPESALKL